MIKRIKHEFNFSDKKHKSYITLVKDSLETKLDGPKDLKEPKPEQEPEIIRDKEIFYLVEFLKSLTGKSGNKRPLGKPNKVPSGLLVD